MSKPNPKPSPKKATEPQDAAPKPSEDFQTTQAKPEAPIFIPAPKARREKIPLTDPADVEPSVSLVHHVYLLASEMGVSPGQLVRKMITESELFKDHMRAYWGRQ